MAEKKVRYRSTFYFDGKQYETTGKSQKEADQKAALKLEKLKRGEVGISGNMSVDRWASEWLETYKKPVVGEGQYKNYLTHINSVIIPAVGNMKLKSVKDINLQKILNSRAGKSRSDLSRLRATMKAMFRRAYLSKLIPYNPAENLELPAAKDGTHRSITDQERKAILGLAEAHYAGLWIKVLLYCGLRPGETRALDWRHVEFDNEIQTYADESGRWKIDIPSNSILEIGDKIILDANNNKVIVRVFDDDEDKTVTNYVIVKKDKIIDGIGVPNDKLTIMVPGRRLIRVEQAMKASSKTMGAPKSASGTRWIPIPNKLYGAIVTARRGPFEPVFTQPTTGRRHTRGSMRCLWENFKRELDISMGAKLYRNQIKTSVIAPDLVPYCLRHSYCTGLQDAGVPINIAKYLMGHSDISTTARVYTHTTEKSIQDAADKINSHT